MGLKPIFGLYTSNWDWVLGLSQKVPARGAAPRPHHLLALVMLRLRSRLARSLCPLARVTMAPSLCLAGGENLHPSFPGTGHPWRPLTRCHVMTAGGRTCRTCLCVMWQHSAAEANLARSRRHLGSRFPLHASRFPLESGGQCRPDKAAG